MTSKKKKISLIIPAYNESPNLASLLEKISKEVADLNFDFEFIVVDDGSTDDSKATLNKLREKYPNLVSLFLSRNFGKEMATTAGINNCTSDACILIDADHQHPPKYIPEFIKKWEDGADVVVGVRKNNSGEGLIKKFGSKLFYSIINKMTDSLMIPNSTDYRLLDKAVIEEFRKMNEHNRITRGLIDWMGFERKYVYFEADRRNGGSAGYSLKKLFGLAINSFVSLSLFPLKIAGYLGIAITLLSGGLGFAVLVSKYLIKNPWGLSITGTASLALIIMFLIGIVLICLGLIGLYIANIHQEVTGRPLYIIKKERLHE